MMLVNYRQEAGFAHAAEKSQPNKWEALDMVSLRTREELKLSMAVL